MWALIERISRGVSGFFYREARPVPLVSNVSATLPQPAYPGFNNSFSTNPEGLDPNFRANAIDSFDLTIQRQISHRVTLEVGYIGRRITHEYQPVELNPVPYMMTLGGQQFKQAYANLVTQYCGGLKGLAGGGSRGGKHDRSDLCHPAAFL